MPSAVRSNASLMGPPGISTKYLKFVNKHNVMFRRSMNWAKTHQAQGGSGYIENPFTSMLLNTRTVRAMAKTQKFKLFRYDMCQHGTQYNKNDKIIWLGAMDRMGIVQNL